MNDFTIYLKKQVSKVSYLCDSVDLNDTTKIH